MTEMKNNQNFVEFIENKVIRHKKANPKDKRLDGQLSGGNLTVFDYFQHYERTWEVHSDTHYKPLMLAYITALDGIDPFIEDKTESGRSSLILKSEIKELQNSKHKYLYIYEV